MARPPAAVLADVAAGLVTPGHAREAYGVVLDGNRVDEAATAELRSARRAALRAGASAGLPPGERPSGDAVQFDFGAARREHERRWPQPLQDAFVELLMGLPAPYRAYVRRTLHARAESLAAERPVAAEDLHRLWHELRASIGLR